MWTAISIIILRISSTYDPGVTIISSITLLTTIFTAIMYVDDTDIFIFGRAEEALQDMVLRGQYIALIWCNGLLASGGALRPGKCWCYLVDFK